MKYSSIKARALNVIAGVAILGMILGACGSSNGSSSSDKTSTAAKTISVGTWGPESGPFAVIGQIEEGTTAYMDSLNKSHGLGSYTVDMHEGNDQYNASLTPGVVRSLVSHDHVVMMCAGAGTPNNSVVKSYLEASKVPNIAPGDGSPSLFIPPNPVEFGLNRPYQPEAAAMARFAIENLHQTKIAIAYSNDDVGTPGMQGAKWELQQHGLKPAATVGFDVTSTNMASEAAALKASGATFVIGWVVDPSFALLVNAAAQIGYKPLWGTPFFNMSIPATITATNGVLAGRSYYVGWTPSPSDSTIVQAAKTYFPSTVQGGETSSLFVQGYVAGYVCGQVLKKAIGMKGGPTSANISAAANSISIGASSPYAPGLSWSPTNHLANISERIYLGNLNGFTAVTPFQTDPAAPLS